MAAFVAFCIAGSCQQRPFRRLGGSLIDPIREANIGGPGIEADEHGDPVGMNPRQIDQADLRAAGHLPMPVLKAIRAKCVDCYCGSPGEIRNCIVTSCPLWPYRMGSNPWRSPKVLSPEHVNA
jgi:hypothetical protein